MKTQLIKVKGKEFKVMVYKPRLWDAILKNFNKIPLKFSDDGKSEIRAFPFGKIAKFESDYEIKEFAKLLLNL